MGKITRIISENEVYNALDEEIPYELTHSKKHAWKLHKRKEYEEAQRLARLLFGNITDIDDVNEPLKTHAFNAEVKGYLSVYDRKQVETWKQLNELADYILISYIKSKEIITFEFGFNLLEDFSE